MRLIRIIQLTYFPQFWTRTELSRRNPPKHRDQCGDLLQADTNDREILVLIVALFPFPTQLRPRLQKLLVPLSVSFSSRRFLLDAYRSVPQQQQRASCTRRTQVFRYNS